MGSSISSVARPISVDGQALGLLGQDLLNLLRVAGEVVDQVVPHLGLVLVLLVAVPRVVGDGEGAAGLEHECDRASRDLHDRGSGLGGLLELLVGDAVGDHWIQLVAVGEAVMFDSRKPTSTLEGDTAGLEGVGAATVVTVDQTHQFRSNVAVVVRRTVSVYRISVHDLTSDLTGDPYEKQRPSGERR